MKAILAYLTFSRFCTGISAFAFLSERFFSGFSNPGQVGQVSHLEARPAWFVLSNWYIRSRIGTPFLLVLTTLGADHVCHKKVSTLHMEIFENIYTTLWEISIRFWLWSFWNSQLFRRRAHIDGLRDLSDGDDLFFLSLSSSLFPSPTQFFHFRVNHRKISLDHEYEYSNLDSLRKMAINRETNKIDVAMSMARGLYSVDISKRFRNSMFRELARANRE